MKIRPVGAEVFSTEGQTDVMKPTVGSRNFGYVPKNEPSFFFRWLIACFGFSRTSRKSAGDGTVSITDRPATRTLGIGTVVDNRCISRKRTTCVLSIYRVWMILFVHVIEYGSYSVHERIVK